MGNLQRLSGTRETCCQENMTRKPVFFFSPACSKSNERVEVHREEICRHLSKTLYFPCQRRQSFTAWVQTISVILWHFDEQKSSAFLPNFLVFRLIRSTFLCNTFIIHFREVHTTQFHNVISKKITEKKKTNTSITDLITAFKDLLIEIVSPLGSSPEGKKRKWLHDPPISRMACLAGETLWFLSVIINMGSSSLPVACHWHLVHAWVSA